MKEVMYDESSDNLIIKEPGWLGSVDGYRYIFPVDVEKDLARLLHDKKVIKKLIFIGDL